MQQTISRRTLLQGGAAIAGAMLLPWSAHGQAVRLRGAWWGSQERSKRTLSVGELYKQKTGIVFEGEGAGWADYWPRLATQVGGGNPPDIMQMELSTLGEYARRGVLLALDDYLGKALDLSDFDRSQIDGGMVDGRFYAVSLGTTANGMMVNAKAWEEAGVELPTAESTWEDIGRMGEQVTKALGRPNYFGLQDSSGIEAVIESWLIQRGKHLYNADGTLGYDAKDAGEWFAMWAEFRKRGACVTPDLQALDQVSIETSMLTLGHSASSFGSANQLVGFQALNQDPILPAPMPKLGDNPTNGIYVKPSQFFSVAAGSDYPDEAVAFINFFVRDNEAASILGLERGIPASAAVREALTAKLGEVERRAAEYVSLVSPIAGPLPPAAPAGAAEINATLKRVSEEVAFGQLTPAEAGEALVAQATDILGRT
ncbi:ABC transporter substrate-binding protein [Chelativorans sp.]|uniref:ABC transporter substrate-binding protein n=1 Tax=Chelativorans sp. TaxID=2203393 RepID=UPI0028123D01|nr:ABC transporter substrate-binding protein [Chelativorans sp.]